MPGRGPKKWWDKMTKEIKKGNPSYSDDQVAKTIGDIWYHQLSESKRKEILKKYEGSMKIKSDNSLIHDKYLNESISHGTLRTEDLIESFMLVLEEADPGTAKEFEETRKTLGDDDAFLMDYLWDAMDSLAPHGYYFGAHGGDGSDFGFWSEEDLGAEASMKIKSQVDEIRPEHLDVSISHGTLKAEDLIESFMILLEEYDPMFAEEANTVRKQWNDDDMFLNEYLFEALENMAPEGYYFGAHEGDGSDFGFWKDPGFEGEGSKKTATGELDQWFKSAVGRNGTISEHLESLFKEWKSADFSAQSSEYFDEIMRKLSKIDKAREEYAKSVFELQNTLNAEDF